MKLENKPIFRTSTNYRYFKKVIPELDKTRITESHGYITAKQRIENMILAGQRLVEYRSQQFDFPDGEVDDNYTDPTRRKNYDLADAFQDSLALENKKINKNSKDEKLKDNSKTQNEKNIDSQKDTTKEESQ